MDLFILVALAAVVVMIVLAVQSRAPGRQAAADAAAMRWLGIRDYANAHNLRLLYVEQVYERHHNGCKARVSIYGQPSSTMRDTWFWRAHVQPGSVVAVALNEGWGSHTRRDDVLFIGSQDHPGVYATLDAAAVRRIQHRG